MSVPFVDRMTDARVAFHTLKNGRRLRYAWFVPEGTPNGTILLGLGRREFIEKKFNEVIKDFLDRGFQIMAFEWRGQGLSDRFLDGIKYQRDYVTDFSIHIGDVHELYTAVLRSRILGPFILCGHSMGSHLLLRWAMEHPDIPCRCIIVTAPMLALAGHVAHTSASLISWGAFKLGFGDDYAASQHDYNDQDREFIANPLTQDPVRFQIMETYFKAYPQMTVGGVTWEWLLAAVKSMHITQRRRYLEALKMPILTLTGSMDRVTPPAEIERYLRLLPRADNVIINGALHDVMNELPIYRTEAWRHIDLFLEKTLTS